MWNQLFFSFLFLIFGTAQASDTISYFFDSTENYIENLALSITTANLTEGELRKFNLPFTATPVSKIYGDKKNVSLDVQICSDHQPINLCSSTHSLLVESSSYKNDDVTYLNRKDFERLGAFLSLRDFKVVFTLYVATPHFGRIEQAKKEINFRDLYHQLFISKGNARVRLFENNWGLDIIVSEHQHAFLPYSLSEIFNNHDLVVTLPSFGSLRDSSLKQVEIKICQYQFNIFGNCLRKTKPILKDHLQKLSIARGDLEFLSENKSLGRTYISISYIQIDGQQNQTSKELIKAPLLDLLINKSEFQRNLTQKTEQTWGIDFIEKNIDEVQVNSNEEFHLGLIDLNARRTFNCSSFRPNSINRVRCLAAIIILDAWAKIEDLELLFPLNKNYQSRDILASIIESIDSIEVHAPPVDSNRDFRACVDENGKPNDTRAFEKGENRTQWKGIIPTPSHYQSEIYFCHLGWDNRTDEQRSQTLVHELVHVGLGLLNKEKLSKDECLITYIQGSMIRINQLYAYKNGYVDSCNNIPSDMFNRDDQFFLNEP